MFCKSFESFNMSNLSLSERFRQHNDGHNGKSLNFVLGNKGKSVKRKENKENRSPVWVEKHISSLKLSDSNGMESRVHKLEEQFDNLVCVVINQSREINGLRNVLGAKPPEKSLESSFAMETKNRTI